MQKIILFELNEVPLRIMDYYRKMRPNSWIARNFAHFRKYETYSENGGHLSPWNTWPTLHRGVSNHKHFITDFNQDLNEVDREFPPVWKILSENKVKTGVFGSLHSYPLPANHEDYAFYVPDVFAAGSECFPKSVELFQDINLKLSRKSARNVDSSIPYKDALTLLAKAPSLGFKFSTMLDVAKQLADEKMDSWKTVRRRTYQTVISFDVFMKLLKTEKPDFTTFFTNHVASSQHRYWAALFPDEYENLAYDDEWISTYNNEILFTMDKTDQMLKQLGKFIDSHPEYQLVVTSSMGQDANECELLETQLYIVDHDKFFETLGFSNSEFEFLPSMLPQFNYSVSNPERFKAALDSLVIDGGPVSYRELGNDRFSVDMGQNNVKDTTVMVGDKKMTVEDLGMENVIIEDKSNATAYHVPEGSLYIYDPAGTHSEQADTSVPTCEILPNIMKNYGLKPSGYMADTKTSIFN